MFAVGIISTFQVFFAPGWLVLSQLRQRYGVIQSLIACVALSLVINYATVLALAAAGIYRTEVVWFLVAVELVMLVHSQRGLLGTSLTHLNARWLKAGRTWLFGQFSSEQEEPSEDQLFLRSVTAAITLVFCILALSSLWWVVRVFISNLGTVFNTWDAVLSWNRWATVWASGSIPSDSGHYPQLMPINWSLMYTLQGTAQLQLFAKACMPIFPFLILLMIFDLGLEFRSYGFFIAVILTYLMIKKFAGEFIADGYVDIPVAFFTMATIYMLLKSSRAKRNEHFIQSVQLAFIFSAGAAVTKQVGLYTLTIAPLMALFFLKNRGQGFSLIQADRKKLVSALALAFLIAAPWYVFKLVQFSQGSDTSNLTYLSSRIYEGAGFFQRGVNAWNSLEKYAWVTAFILPALFVLPANLRVVGIALLPFILIWAFFFSYDTRNITQALPLIACCVGTGIEGYTRKVIDLIVRLRIPQLKTVVWGLLVILVLLAASAIITDQALFDQQVNQQKQIFNPALNEKLYAYLETHDQPPRILTNYPVGYLPGLENAQVNFWYNDPMVFEAQIQEGEITHLLAPLYPHEHIEEIIQQNLESGKFTLIFEETGFIPYRFIRVN